MNYTPSSEIVETKKVKSLFSPDQKNRKSKKKPSLTTKIDDLATKITPNDHTIRRRLKLLDLPAKVQIMVDNGVMNLNEAETLVSLKEIVDIKIKTE